MLGVRELGDRSSAEADFRPTDFRVYADEIGGTVIQVYTKKNAAAVPREVNGLRNPLVPREVELRDSGKAIFKRYNDGRWVLTSVHWTGITFDGNVEVQGK